MIQPLIIITGSIGSGKSALLEVFRSLGFQTASADETARALLSEDSQVREALLQHFGHEILDANGELSRSALAQRVFDNPLDKRVLESILHPRIRQHFEAQFQAYIGKHPFVYEVPLYFETGGQYPKDAIILVITAPLETSLARLQNNPRFTREDFLKRRALQVPDEEKVQAADYVIVNDGDLDQLKRKVQRFLKAQGL